MSLEIINQNEQKVSVKIKGVPLLYANALRRICLNGVPIYAVESVDVLENSSVLADEAREIQKGIDHVERINHGKNGKLMKKTSFMSELSDL